MSINKVFYRSPHNYDWKEASDEASIKDQGISLTIQSQAEDADINVMVRRFGITGQITTSVRVPEYGDFMGISDYRSALHQVMEAQDNFERLQPELRARFNNDPQEFLEFATNSENIGAMRELGLAKPLETVSGKNTTVVETVSKPAQG